MSLSKRMPTKYDVFAKLIEHAPSSANDLFLKTPVYAHLRSLIKEELIKKEKKVYVPIKNPKSELIVKIIKYCLKNGLEYNKILSKNVPTVMNALFASAPLLRPDSIKGNKENTEIVSYLEKHQFMLIYKKRPRMGIVVKHQLFENIKELHHKATEIKTSTFVSLIEEVSKLESKVINPFDGNIFAFLSGSAQLEGSTITVGETRDMLMHDIYPDKPKKDIQMVKNLNEALHYILEHKEEEITPEHIKEMNKIVLFSLHRHAGKYKITHNKIQGNPHFKTISPEKVPQAMNYFCQELKNITNKRQCLKKMGFIHNELQHIHPFADGNSRTTRMILNWVLLKNKIPLLVIKMGCFDEYMQLTKLGVKRDDAKLTALSHHILIHENLIN